LSVATLAREAGVSPAGVVRFATALGFQGYPDFQRAIQAIIRSELRQGERFAATITRGSRQPLWKQVLAQEAENIATLRTSLDGPQFGWAVRMIAAAKAVTIAGFRASATLAQYFWYNLRKVRDRVALLTSPGSVTLEEVRLAGRAGALFVFITFPRYSNELLDVATYGRRAQFPAIGVTNNELSPLGSLCDVVLCAEVTEISFTDFYASPMALLNALIAEVAARLGKRALDRLNMLDDLAAEQGYLFPRSRRISGRAASGRVDAPRGGILTAGGAVTSRDGFRSARTPPRPPRHDG
jgi:DNA-binding MurR/RpiR family transcriptional regulator